MDNSKTELFESMPIPKAVVTLSVPSVISSLVMVIYSLADTFFVGMMNDPVQNAAVTLAAPLLLAFNAVNNLFGIGSSSMMSRALGRKDYDTVYRSSAFGFYASLICSLLFSLLYGVLQSPILVMLGANAETMQATADYLFWTVLLGSAPSILNVVLGYLVRAEGSSLHASIGTMCGCLLNIVLDPIFMFGLGLGTAGAGIATALSQSISFCILLSMFLRGKTVSQFRIAAVTREAREFGMILVGGAPSFGRQGLQSIGGMLLNIAARSYGDAAVAGMSIVSRIFMFIISVAIGVGQGLQPVAAFNYGARKFRRVQKAAVFTMGAAFCMLVVLVALCWVDSDALIRLFRDDPEVTAVALPAFHYQCLAILLQPVIVVANMTFQSVGKAGRATFLACCRQGVFFIPLILILPRTFGLVGVEICQPIADALTFIVSLPFLLAFLKQLDRMDDAEKAKAQS